MNSIADGAGRGRILPLLAFALETHPPVVYIPVALAWSWSVLLMLESQRGRAGVDLHMLAVSVVFFLILLFLRAIDEIKDFDYDRVHNPKRPLVRGAVSSREVWWLAGLVAACVIIVSAALAPLLAAFAAANMAYGLFLMGLEQRVRRFRESILLNLCITFPVSAALNVFAWLYLTERGMAPSPQWAAVVMVTAVCIFLHMEFGRKLKWPQLTDAGENGYALVLGVPGAMAVCAVLGITACVLASWLQLHRGAGAIALLPWLALLPSLEGFRHFLANQDRAVELKPFFGGAMIIFFLLNIVVATH